MICECTSLIKKRTITDGVKSLSGVLTIFQINGENYLQTCCFKTIIKGMYSFVSKEWFLFPEAIIVKDDIIDDKKNIIHIVFKVSDIIMNLIKPYQSYSNLEINYVSNNVYLLEESYMNTQLLLQKARRSIIELEKELKAIRYQYSSVKFDNENLQERRVVVSDIEANNDVSYTHNKCSLCNAFPTIKEELKLIKQENVETISRLRYENKILEDKMKELMSNHGKLIDTIERLKEENQMLRNSSYLSYE